MKILIDDTRLNLLLEQKKQFIGKKVAWDSFLSAMFFLVSVLFATYNDFLGLPGSVLKTVFVILGIAFFGKSIFDIVNSLKNSYSFEDLLNIVIKDSFDKFPNRFLVYEDKRWDCDFFLNYKENPNNENFIKEHISRELKIDMDDIELTFVAQKIHDKYSETAKENKVYSHKFYMADIKSFPEYMKADSFECDGRSYHWRSLAELELDDNVQKKNLDILNFVKELF